MESSVCHRTQGVQYQGSDDGGRQDPSRISCCLFFYFTVVLRPTQGYFTYMETSPIAGEGLQILTYTRHLWPLSSEGSLTCHIYCDTGHRFLLSQSEGQETKPGAGEARAHDLTINHPLSNKVGSNSKNKQLE